ncbi:C_GCAxxG_C_C family protein [Desulfofundulus sp. TPOSR]|jgi:C_GCAxxG_C_C family probable redox protein|uniref:C_GCAxxG_C_C family protein n=1 Tax=Desulfofundulus kuznetsovii (strain DSM 6115 / VKM B-1805 / 17) TaxID=760568 RepID=A0AAU8PIW4_DESK7|nr:C-GCAxxG-C-C family protein [Desulfofundulus sp. TPOSR]AEG15667.1 C_GCAxxG_C_C family protein [Desulfofundulus kuznetsovii DSM 6115]NHM27673.1 C_GCAxxG_C_C family protein [Desulfofundulus sp. TPOSR]
MAEDLALEARNRAGNYFREGYNCAESIFLTFRELVVPEVERDLVRLATGFGGGLGHAGCLCGALTASTMVLGLLCGRTDHRQDRYRAYGLAKDFHDRFEEKFGATCCRALNPHPFDTPEHLRYCLKITGNTARLLMEYLQEKNLI